ncbi:hypothetical protein KAU33_13545 [Candidatus Dependentiae bacterium]|nr:hypothetical protein [Candidatus Dependentiae bacterium]
MKQIKLFLLITIILISFHILSYSEKGTNLIPDLQKKCEDLNEDFEGTIIVMEPDSGRIFAISNPGFSIKSRIQPGSVFKPVIAYIALESMMVTPFYKVNCNYKYEVYNKILFCSWAEGHKQVNMEKAIAVSCNYYFYTIARLIGEEKMLSYFQELDLDKKTDIDIEGEVKNSIPKQLDEIELANIGIGVNSELLLTPIKIMQIMNIFPANGKLVKPVYYSNSKKHIQKQVKFMHNENSPILNGMKRSVEVGTSKGLNLKPFKVSGKTGTSPIDNSNLRDNWALFFGFYPYNNPEVSILVIVKGGYGSTDAVPVARSVFLKYFEIKEYSKELVR